MLTIPDEQQRLAALDPKQSFIVQAPAGSGKTELLTQRFLILLSHVKEPEEILAITFTKKSAAEMRTRIISALQNALVNPEPAATHAKKTWLLAKKVLQQDRLLKWNLLASPNRLRLQTIDSFNASLTRQLPLLSHFGATPDITNDPYPLYQKAVSEFLSHLEDDQQWSNAIATILLHMDNDLNKVESLLINLLAKRDQWLRHITLNASDEFLRNKLETQLTLVVTDILEKLQHSFPKLHADELLLLLRYAASHPDSTLKYCGHLTALPGSTVEDLPYWQEIQTLLFTQKDEWRKKFTYDLGFPPASAFKNSEEKNLAIQMKARITDLVEKFRAETALKNHFIELRNAPEVKYKETQWQTLDALHTVLRIVAAQLKLIFQQHGKIDYIENSLGALTALGTDESPTDLTLALDYQIKHILIDEFQDTSNSQYHLLKKITTGWEPNDGRTLFLVGDPMQSIYRFREAEVGIFIRARKYGMGQIKLTPLTLAVNFRSTPHIVNWVNEKFPYVFPEQDDITTGAVAYSASIANKEAATDALAVSLHAFPESTSRTNAAGQTDGPAPTHAYAINKIEADSILAHEEDTQAPAIIALIQKRKALNPTDTIAILVRSRTHLKSIIPLLKNANIAYRAIDIDPLTDRPFIQDLIALTRALLHPADRIAWLSILRAPWCGLSLNDLLILTGNDPKISLWERMQIAEVIASLPLVSQQRLRRLFSVMKVKMNERNRFSLRVWIESTWLLLGGPACVDHITDLDDVNAYFKLIDQLEQTNHFLNPDLLDDYVKQLYAAPNQQADDTLQIMTIHNAKGLEFDTVILPHLERKASHDDKQLLLWMERTRNDESTSLILAPVHAIGQESDSIYDYIQREHAIKNDYERGRLLYVAVTRAKKHLDLFFSVKENGNVNTSSLLEKLWPSIKHQVALEDKKNTSEIILPIDYHSQNLKRLVENWHNPVSENRLAETIAYHQKKSGFLLPDPTPKYIGTLVHQVLQQMSQQGIDWWEKASLENQSLYIKNQLLTLGASMTQLDEMIKKVHFALENTLRDPRGRWILSPHTESQAEFKLTAFIDKQPQSFVIDRTFIDKNIRWIIDYKTTTPANDQLLSSFLLDEQKKYQAQMWYYFQAIREIDHRPIRMGLYFPTIPAWHEWEFDSIERCGDERMG